MTLTVQPLRDSDVEKALRIQYLAFRHPSPIGILLSPAPEPPDEFIAAFAKSRREAMRTNKAIRFMTVVDSDTDEIVACAQWDVFPEERTAEEVEKLCHVPPPPPDAVQDAWVDFFGHFSAQRRELGNRPIVILHALVTHPDHQRKGAGKLLLQRFVEEVDREGLETYLEASEIARPLYVRFGFAPTLEKVFDLEKYGKQGKEVNTVRCLL